MILVLQAHPHFDLFPPKYKSNLIQLFTPSETTTQTIIKTYFTDELKLIFKWN